GEPADPKYKVEQAVSRGATLVGRQLGKSGPHRRFLDSQSYAPQGYAGNRQAGAPKKCQRGEGGCRKHTECGRGQTQAVKKFSEQQRGNGGSAHAQRISKGNRCRSKGSAAREVKGDEWKIGVAQR